MQITEKDPGQAGVPIPEAIPSSTIVPDEQGYLYDSSFREMQAGKAPGTSAEMQLNIESIRAMVLAGKLAHAELEEHLSRVGVTLQQYRTLKCIGGSGTGGTQLHPIASWLGVTPRNVTGLIDALEAQGLAERVADPHDRRAVIAQLTPAGRVAVEKGRRIHEAALKRLLGSLSTEEKLQLRHLSLKLVLAATAAAAETRKASG